MEKSVQSVLNALAVEKRMQRNRTIESAVKANMPSERRPIAPDELQVVLILKI